MRKPAEHGNVISSAVLGVTAIFNAVFLERNLISILFWIPIWSGLFIFDIPIKMILQQRENVIIIAIIAAASLISIIINLWLLIPYVIFFTVYSTRIYLLKKRASFISIILGILGYTTLFSFTFLKDSTQIVIITGTLFLFMVGSEFLVRSVIKRNKYLSLYNLITLPFYFIKPALILYSISLIRIIAAFKVNKIKIIGIMESTILIISLILLEIFVILK